MKLTEIEPLVDKAKRGRSSTDRLTPLLIGAVFLLIAGLAAVATDVILQPVGDGSAGDGPAGDAAVAEAIAAEPSALPPIPSASPAIVPSVQAPSLAFSPIPSASPATVPSVQAPSLAFSPTVEPATQAPVTPPACVPPDDWSIHIVQQGNTLRSLARRYGTDVDSLMRVNCLNTGTIFIGQRLYVPGSLATPASAVARATPPFAPDSTIQPVAPSLLGGEASALVPALTPSAAGPLNTSGQYLNIVLLGSDKRPGSGAWRTDSMIVVSVDTFNNVVRLLSIPRDLWVYIPGHGNNRINTADLWGELAKKGSGPDRVKQTIYYNLGIPIHYYVRVDFQGFMKIIDTVGGIDVDVDCPLPDIKLTAGMQHFDGPNALRYARSRYSTNDFDRGRRQRKVLMALWDQALTLDIIPKLPELWWTMANSFQTDLSLDQVINLAYVGARLKSQRILSRSIGPSLVESWMTPQGAAVLLPRKAQIRAMLEDYYASADTSHLDAVEKVRVQVLNGSTRREAEQLAAAALGWAGFKVVSRGVADRQNYPQTQIAVYTGNTAAAQKLAQELNVPSATIQDLTGAQQPDPANPVDIQVILGRDYDPCQR
jgi:polyisoprenyl-teichoic acid--peptidoglycan teichoic acid transferase